MKAKIYTVFRKRFHGSHTSHMSKVFLLNVCKPATLLFSIYYRKIQKQAIIKDFFFIFTYGENSVEMSFVTEFKDENHNYLFKE